MQLSVLLGPSNVVFGHSAKYLAGFILADLMRDIAEAKYANHSLVTVSDGQTPDLLCLHDFDSDPDVVVRRAANNILRHDVLGCHFCDIATIAYGPTRDVAIRYNPYQMAFAFTGIAPTSLSRMRFATSLTEVVGSTHVAPLCIASLTFI